MKTRLSCLCVLRLELPSASEDRNFFGNQVVWHLGWIDATGYALVASDELFAFKGLQVADDAVGRTDIESRADLPHGWRRHASRDAIADVFENLALSFRDWSREFLKCGFVGSYDVDHSIAPFVESRPRSEVTE